MTRTVTATTTGRLKAAWKSVRAVGQFFVFWYLATVASFVLGCVADLFTQACVNGRGIGGDGHLLLAACAPAVGLAIACVGLVAAMRRVEVRPHGEGKEPTAAAAALARRLGRLDEPFRTAGGAVMVVCVGGLAGCAVFAAGAILPWCFGHRDESGAELAAVMWSALAACPVAAAWYVRRVSRRVRVVRPAAPAA